jgi:hypothetical protein
MHQSLAVAFVAPVANRWRTSPEAIRAYTYIPRDSEIPALYTQENVDDPIVHLKLFNPRGSWTWYLTEADRETGIAFGLTIGHEIELGYVDLNELATATHPPIERDIHFRPQPLSECRKRHEGQS